ncbi:MAG: hypothetical protein OJF50_005132 [Nitrospira sp.]|nr:hypothetical protein [Nitrospira sp.]
MARDQPPTLPPDPVIERYKRDVNRTLLQENLKLSVGYRPLDSRRHIHCGSSV